MQTIFRMFFFGVVVSQRGLRDNLVFNVMYSTEVIGRHLIGCGEVERMRNDVEM